MITLFADTETRWLLELRDHGTMRCATDPSAGFNCISYAVNDSAVQIVPYVPNEIAQALRKAFETTTLADVIELARRLGCSELSDFICWFFRANRIVAHNALFEIVVFKEILGMERPLETWIDSMAMCAYYGYPRGLDDAAKALQCSKLKDIQGKSAMLKLATCRYTPETAPDDFNRLYSYGGNDTDVMREIFHKLPLLPDAIAERWRMDAEINLRGMPIDTTAVSNALAMKPMLDAENDARMCTITGGAIRSPQQAKKIPEWVTSQGVPMSDCQAETVAKLLQQPLPENVRQCLSLRQEAGLASVAKFEAIARYVVNGHLHLMMDWYGAHTGRPTGSGPQMLNLPGSEVADIWAERLCNQPWVFQQISYPTERMKDSLRGMICAGEDELLGGMDLAQIEARATAWMAGEQKLLDLFLSTDPYCTYASTVFNRPITKKENPNERQAGKAGVLSNSFAGGIGAAQRIATKSKMDLAAVALVVLPTATPSEMAEADRCYEYYLSKFPPKPLPYDQGCALDVLKQRFRRDFARVVAFWDELEEAFLKGGQAGPIHIDARGDLRVSTLPSGRQLFYHGVRIHKDGAYSYEGRHNREFLWKGTVIENHAQAINQDISDWYKMKANREIAPVIHHCYDEFTTRFHKSRRDDVERGFKQLMQERPPNYPGLPLGFDMWIERRYGK